MQGFPTLAWVEGKSGAVSVYSGDRSLADLTSFVKGKGSKAGAAAGVEEEEEVGGRTLACECGPVHGRWSGFA